jgi:hypothetical protein
MSRSWIHGMRAEIYYHERVPKGSEIQSTDA